LKRKRLTGFDLCNLTSGSAQYFERIGADTIQRICVEYAQKRSAAKRRRLRWRVSRGALRFCGKTFRIFEAERLVDVNWGQGCFAQDAVGDWWLCLSVEQPVEQRPAPEESVGIDLGLKDIAVTSDGDRLEAGRFYRGVEAQIAQAQRRGHRRQAKRLHRKAARRRADALHKFSRKIVDQYETIVVGDVSSQKLPWATPRVEVDVRPGCGNVIVMRGPDG
jgi:putative transposase